MTKLDEHDAHKIISTIYFLFMEAPWLCRAKVIAKSWPIQDQVMEAC